MRQAVTVTRRADRHEQTHERRFAESRRVLVAAGTLADVLRAIADATGDLPRGSYVIDVEWPHDQPRTEVGRIAADLGLGLVERPSPPGTAPWEVE